MDSSNNSSSQVVTRDLHLLRRLRMDSKLLMDNRLLTVLRHTALHHTTRALDSLRKAMADMFVFTCTALHARVWYG